MLRTSLLALGLCLTFLAGAKPGPSLVDDILNLSSIKLSIDNIPNQMSQFPALMPVEGEEKSKFSNAFFNEMSESFNEAEALSQIRDHVLQFGREAELAEVKAWLQSSVGRRATQAELLLQGQDPKGVHAIMQSFDENILDEDRRRALKAIVAQAQVGELMFEMLERMMEPTLQALVESRIVSIESTQARDEYQQNFSLKLNRMRHHLQPVFDRQILALFAFTYGDLSLQELQAFAAFSGSKAGQHYYQITNSAFVDVSVGWMTRALPKVIGLKASTQIAAD